MGTGGTSTGSLGTTVSIRNKIKEIASSLVKMASGATNGLKAVWADLNASEDKVIASLPGRANQEIPNKSVKSILSEGVKFSDILKIVMGIALSTITGNPIPLIFAQRHAKNLSERIKAKEKEVLKQARENKKIATRSAQRRLNRNEADYRQLKAIRGRINAKAKEARLAVRRVEKQATKTVSDVDKKIIKDVKLAFVKLGYKPTDAKKAAEIALTKTNSRDIETVINLAVREAASLGNK